MSPSDYQAYTNQLADIARQDNRVLGFIVLGSTAATHHQPDEWSDHDFWLVVEDETQEQFHSDLSWIPQHEQIVLAFRETQHGWKIVFESGHVLEYAIFSLDELRLARFHHYKVLVDKGHVEARLMDVKTTFVKHKKPDSLYLTQHLLSLIVIGMGRYHRGEKVSGLLYIKHHVLEQLTALIQTTLPPEKPELVDELSASRRIELTHPQLAAQLHGIINASVPDAALMIVDLVESLQEHIPNFPEKAIPRVRQIITYESRLS